MTHLLTPKHAHARSSPSVSLEKGEARLRAPSENYKMGRMGFHTNNDTGIDKDGVLKTGYLSGNPELVGEGPPSPTRSPVLRRGTKGTPHTPEIASMVDLQTLRRERARKRARRIRQAGGLPSGDIPFLLLLMTICLVVILYVWIKVRELG